jgi:hypothetical protein
LRPKKSMVKVTDGGRPGMSRQPPAAGHQRLLLTTAHAVLAARADLLDQGRLVGELPGFELRVEQVAVHLQLEAAALRRDERQFLDLLLVLRQQLGRQTDGLRLVVSHRAVSECNLNRIPPLDLRPRKESCRTLSRTLP